MIKRLKEWFANKPHTKAQYISAVATVLIGIISGIALYRAETANILARRALEVQQELFFKENKPYLSVTLSEWPDSHTLYKYDLIPNANSIVFSVRYSMKNIGRSGARYIQFFKELRSFKTGQGFVQDPNVTLILPDTRTLGPGESVIITLEVPVKARDTQVFEAIAQELASGDGIRILAQVGLTYSNELNPEQMFKTTVAHKLRKKTGEIIKSQYQAID